LQHWLKSFKNGLGTGAAVSMLRPQRELGNMLDLYPLFFLGCTFAVGRNYAAQRRGKKETAHTQPVKIVRNVRTLPKHLQGRVAHKELEKKAGNFLQ